MQYAAQAKLGKIIRKLTNLKNRMGFSKLEG
jgi:hypothetical protein